MTRGAAVVSSPTGVVRPLQIVVLEICKADRICVVVARRGRWACVIERSRLAGALRVRVETAPQSVFVSLSRSLLVHVAPRLVQVGIEVRHGSVLYP